MVVVVNRCFVVYGYAFVYSACIFFVCHFLPLPCVTAIHGGKPSRRRFVSLIFCLRTGAACTFIAILIQP